MDWCLDFIQRVEHGNRDSVIAAHDEDLCAGAEEFANEGVYARQVAVISASFPRHVAAVKTAYWPYTRKVATDVKVPVICSVGYLSRTLSDRIGCPGLIVGSRVPSVGLAVWQTDQCHIG
jgi:hypothetical protein